MEEIRQPAVAGAFYPARSQPLRDVIDWCFRHPLGPATATHGKPPAGPRALICPHAGYRYSGPVAAHAYQALLAPPLPELVVVIGPNHHMHGPPVAVPRCTAWRTPLGLTSIDLAAAESLCLLYPAAEKDDAAHAREHSIEVQVPFLQHVLGTAWKLLPVVTYEQDLPTSSKLGQAIAEVVRGRNAVVVASSDFSHYETHEAASRQDSWALRAIEAMDVDGLVRAIDTYRISMCGPGPVIAAMVAGYELGATRGRTLRYATSGEVGGDYSNVVGYAAVAIE